MLPMIIGLAIFFLVHLLPTAPDMRRGLIERFGKTPYLLAFSLVSLVGFGLIVAGFAKLQVMPGKNPEIWSPPAFMRHITMTLMLFAFILLAAAYIPSRIRTYARHPMLLAIKLWALGHLLVNGDLGSIVLFGSFLAWAVFDRISVKRRAASGLAVGEQGKGPLGDATGGLTGDIAVVVVGVAAYAAMLLWGHAALIGVPILAR